MILGTSGDAQWAMMGSGRAQIGVSSKKDAPEQTRARIKRSDRLVNADRRLTGDQVRTGELTAVTARKLLIGSSDRADATLQRHEPPGMKFTTRQPGPRARGVATTHSCYRDRVRTHCRG